MRSIVWLLLLAIAISAAMPVIAADSPRRIEAHLQAVLDEVVSASDQHLGVLASVNAPGLHLNWSGAAGTTARGSTVALRPNQPFRIASVTKVFVAAAVFRLIEDGHLGLYDPIAEHISSGTAQLLESGGYNPKAITIAELLGHTSGLYDYAMDAAYDRAVMADKSRHWTSTEQIRWAMRHGKPVGKPGEKYSYADTNYVILGEIIHRLSGKSLAAYVRQSLHFGALGLNSTYWELLEPKPQRELPRAHQYFDQVDVTANSPTMDLYGGGGLVSTTADLDRFMRVLLTGRLFRRASTLAMSLLPVEPIRSMHSPRALMLVAGPFGRHTCWGHEGYWGTIALYCPDIDVAVAATIDESLDDQTPGAAMNRKKLLNGIASVLDAALTDRAAGK